MESVRLPKLSSSELTEIHNEGLVTKVDLDAIGIDTSSLDVDNPIELRRALRTHYLKESVQLSDEEIEEIDQIAPPTKEEIEALGIDMSLPLPQQQSEAMLHILGRDYDLDPSDASRLLATNHMTNYQLLQALQTPQALSALSETSETSTLKRSIATLRKKSSSERTLAVAPPEPEMSMNSFITAISRAIAMVLDTKGQMNAADMEMAYARLEDIMIISQQKIAHQEAAATRQAELMSDILHTMKVMHAIQIALTVTVLLITIILAIVLAVVTGGTLAWVSAGMVIGVAALMASLSITEAELNRQGDSMFGDSQFLRWLTFAVLTVAQIIFTFGLAAAIMAAKAAAEIAWQAALSLFLFVISQVVSNTISLLQTTKVGEKTAETRRDDAKASSDAQADQEKESARNELKARYDSGAINRREYRSQLNTRTSEINSANKARQEEIKADYKSDMKIIEIMNYVLMALSMVVGLGSSAASAAAAKAASQATQKAMQSVLMSSAELIEAIASATEAALGLVLARLQLQQHQEQVDVLEFMGEHTKGTKFYEALYKLFEDLQKSSDSIRKQSYESMQGLIEALMGVVTTNFRAMDKMGGRAV